HREHRQRLAPHRRGARGLQGEERAVLHARGPRGQSAGHHSLSGGGRPSRPQRARGHAGGLDQVLGQRAGLLLLPGPPGEHRGDAGDPRDHAARVSLGGGREERGLDDPVNALLAASPAPYETGSKRIEKAVRQAPPISRSSFIAGRAWGLGSYENGAASPPSRSPASPSSQALAASWTAGASRHRPTEARSE